MENELVLLANKIDFAGLEKEFAPLYSKTGTPSKPIRLMVGLLILKQMYDYGDETIMGAWVRDPYMQYFCGEGFFQHQKPCDPTDLVHFRKRIGAKGVEKIFAQSINLFEKKLIQESEIIVDTTAQEKNITFPTDTKLAVKIIKQCDKISKREGLKQRQSYKRKIKDLLIKVRFSRHPKKAKEARAAQRKIKTIAGRVTRELERNTAKTNYHKDKIIIFKKILAQEKNSPNKIYSLHELDVACIAKGKAHKPYEFGSKASFAITKSTGIITSAVNFKGNPNDKKTIVATLKQHEHLTGKRATVAIVDRGYQNKNIESTQVIIPTPQTTTKDKLKARKRFRRRSSIEPIIGHLKEDYRLCRNYLKGVVGDEINVLLSAAAFNFKKWMRLYSPFYFWQFLLGYFTAQFPQKYSSKKIFYFYRVGC